MLGGLLQIVTKVFSFESLNATETMKAYLSIRERVSLVKCPRPKKRRKPYRRYLWLDLNKTKTGINHFKSTISTT
jgi:hypothetical protein